MEHINKQRLVMKKKIIYIITSGPFVFAVGSIASFWLASECYFWWPMLIIIVTGIYWSLWKEFFVSDKKAIKEYNKRQERYKQEREEKRRVLDGLRPVYQKNLDELVSKYGKPDKIINLEVLKINKSIIVFAEKKRLWLLGRDMPMESIIDCKIQDDEYSYDGGSYSETKTNTGSMLKRAAVGTLVAGAAGAVIGGATAKRTTTTFSAGSCTGHKYYVYININDLSEPVVKIDMGSDFNRANEILGLFSVIIERNKMSSYGDIQQQ